MLELLNKILENEPRFRLKQVWQAIFINLIESWDENSTLPKELREKLKKGFPLKIGGKIFSSNKSESTKVLITLDDGLAVESVLLRHNDGRRTVCVSSQVGCPLGCLFCATGKLGFKRNLFAWEIVQQVLFFARLLKKSSDKNKRITNVVFMGMGEPFLNYDNVMNAVRVLNDKSCFGIGARHISVSTCGIVEAIEKFSKESLQLNLAISLHAPNDELRSMLMPINKKYHLAKLMSAIQGYVEKRQRRVMFEYVLIHGINDTDVCARQLAELMNNNLYMVNLIRYNPTNKFQPAKSKTIKRFKDILVKNGVDVTQRYSFGQDVDAACGQLAGKAKK